MVDVMVDVWLARRANENAYIRPQLPVEPTDELILHDYFPQNSATTGKCCSSPSAIRCSQLWMRLISLLPRRSFLVSVFLCPLHLPHSIPLLYSFLLMFSLHESTLPFLLLSAILTHLLAPSSSNSRLLTHDCILLRLPNSISPFLFFFSDFILSLSSLSSPSYSSSLASLLVLIFGLIYFFVYYSS